MLGAPGTIGRAMVRALVRRGDEVVCFLPPRPGAPVPPLLAAVTVRQGDLAAPAAVARDAFAGEAIDAVVSCMASLSAATRDAWAVDYQAHGFHNTTAGVHIRWLSSPPPESPAQCLPAPATTTGTASRPNSSRTRPGSITAPR